MDTSSKWSPEFPVDKEGILTSLLHILIKKHPEATRIHLVTRPHAKQDREAMAFYKIIHFKDVKKAERIPETSDIPHAKDTINEQDIAYFGTKLQVVSNFITNSLIKHHKVNACYIKTFTMSSFPGQHTPERQYTSEIDNIINEADAHHHADENDADGKGDQQSVRGIIQVSTHLIVAYNDDHITNPIPSPPHTPTSTPPTTPTRLPTISTRSPQPPASHLYPLPDLTITTTYLPQHNPPCTHPSNHPHLYHTHPKPFHQI